MLSLARAPRSRCSTVLAAMNLVPRMSRLDSFLAGSGLSQRQNHWQAARILWGGLQPARGSSPAIRPASVANGGAEAPRRLKPALLSV